jgi:hypothetical protein
MINCNFKDRNKIISFIFDDEKQEFTIALWSPEDK